MHGALALVLLLAGAVLTAQQPPRPREQHLRVGDALPIVPLAGFSQTEARSLAEFTGRVLLIDFFGYWNPASARSIEHMEKLLAEFGPRGFSVLAVTDDDERKSRAWIRAHGVDYAFAFDETGELHRLLRVERLPTAVLVDPFGMLLWSGNPLALTNAPIERALAGCMDAPAWTWPPPARSLADELWSGRYADALAACADPASEALVRARIAEAVAHFERLVAEKQYRRALVAAQRMDLGRLPEAAALRERVTGLLADAGIVRRAELERELSELERRAEALRSVAETEALRRVVAAFVERHAGEPVEPGARALLATLDAALARPEKD